MKRAAKHVQSSKGLLPLKSILEKQKCRDLPASQPTSCYPLLQKINGQRMQLAKNCTVGSSLICSYFCSAFFIGNRQNFIKKECSVHKVWTLTHQEITSWEIRDRDEKNSVIEMLVVRPQALDQSKRVKANPSRIWLSDQDTFSKVLDCVPSK